MLQGFTRARRGRIALAAGAALALVVVGASPAAAHKVGLGGGTVCHEGDHLILWGIGNSQPAQAMTITSATATLGGDGYGVSGYTNPVPGGSFTYAGTIIPGALTGTVTLTVSVMWDATFSDTRTHSVTLTAPCPTPTSTTTTTTTTSTTTTAPTTSTTAPDTASTTVPTSTTATTVTAAGTTVPVGATSTTLAATSQGASTPTSAAGETLPRTGGSGTAAWFGLAVLAAGAVALVLVPYRPLRKHAPRAR